MLVRVANGGKPYDGHTLATVTPAIETQVGATLTRIIADAGYKEHKAPETHRFKSLYRRPEVRHDRRHQTPDEAQGRRRIGYRPLRDDQRIDRTHLAGIGGGNANAVLVAVRYNFRRLLTWLRLFAGSSRIALATTSQQPQANRLA